MKKIKKYFEDTFNISSALLGVILGMSFVLVIGIITHWLTPKYFGNLGDWVSAAGTFAAVVVSLYIAKESRPNSKISWKINSQLDNCESFETLNNNDKVKVYLGMWFTNEGTVPLDIKKICYQMHIEETKTIPKNWNDYSTDPKNDNNPELPIQILPGQSVKFVVSIVITKGGVEKNKYITVKPVLATGWTDMKTCKIKVSENETLEDD